jgi:hypothetical protein
LGGGYLGYALGDQWAESAREDASSRFYQCLNNENFGSGSEECERREREINRIRPHHWQSAALVGLGPIPIAWLVAYVLAAIMRWRERRPVG